MELKDFCAMVKILVVSIHDDEIKKFSVYDGINVTVTKGYGELKKIYPKWNRHNPEVVLMCNCLASIHVPRGQTDRKTAKLLNEAWVKSVRSVDIDYLAHKTPDDKCVMLWESLAQNLYDELNIVKRS